jgi:hypothetical protein
MVLKVTDEKRAGYGSGAGSVSQRCGSADLDPDLRTQISRIRNTAVESIFLPSTMIEIVSNGEVDEIKYIPEFESSMKS